MKKVLIAIGIIIGIVVLAAFLVPVIFKDDIRAAIDKALAESVDADFVFETDDFSVTLFDHFPNPSANLKNFGIINRAPFDGEILFAVEELEAVISLRSLFSDQITIKGVVLDNAKAYLKVLEDGTANWDIAISDSTALTPAQEQQASAGYNIGIDHWEIKNGEVLYEDLSIPFTLKVTGLQHEGSGDFTQDVIDMKTYSLANSVTVSFDGTEYITNKVAEIDMMLKISENFERLDFKENLVRINDFKFGFAGGYKMLPDGYDLDLNFQSKDNSFKSLLSLIPGMYHDDFERIEAQGQLQFEGMVKGRYDSLQYPAFDINMNVTDAAFKYPDVEESFSDIQMALNMKNETNQIENTRIDLSNFHLLMGGEPFDGHLLVENLINYPVDAAFKGSLNLGNLNKMMPMEGVALQGILDMDINANGVYDSVKQIMPKLDGKLSLNNGYIKSSDFPSALEQFNVDATTKNETGNFSDFVMNVSNFTFVMDGEPFEGKLMLSDLNNYKWDLIAKGIVDLEKMSKILALENMELKGRVSANVNTKGDMKSLEEERYDKLPTSGNISLTNFQYSDSSMAYNVTLSEMNATFNPQSMEIQKMDGAIGESDFKVNGQVRNYIGYFLSDTEVLKGTFNFSSNSLDLNEFMSEEGEDTPAVEGEESGVLEIPKNVDMTLNSNIKSAKLMDMEMKDIVGAITVKDGVAKMNNVNFNLLDGKFITNGSYDPTDVKQPKYDFGLNIKDLSIREAFETFEIVKNYAPIAEKITGKFSTDFSLNGLLNQKMSPELGTVNGQGVVSILQAALKDSKIVKGLTSITKLNNSDEVYLKNIKLNASIEKGSLVVEPFDLTLLGYQAIISGSTSIDGNINYLVKMNVPAGQAAQILNQFTGGTSDSQTIQLPINVTGTYNDPKFGLQTSEMKNELKQAAKDQAKEEVKEQVTDVLDKVVKDDKLKDAVGGILGNKKDSTQKADTTKNESLKDQAGDKAKETIKDLFKKKGGN